MKTLNIIIPSATLAILSSLAWGADIAAPGGESSPPGPREPTINRAQGVKLNPDDTPAFPDPPAGFKARREDIPHGKLEMIEYDSKSVGTTFQHSGIRSLEFT